MCIRDSYKGIFRQMAATFGFKYVISTLRESFSATHNGWKAMIYNGEEFYESKMCIRDRIKEKYGDERRSEIVYASEEFNPEDFYADDDMVITISHMRCV